MNHIKFFFLLIASSMMLQSCTSSEEKALKLVDDYVASTLFNPNSYQRTNYSIDSLFSTDGSADVYIGLFEVSELIEELKPLMRDIESSKVSMAIYGDCSTLSSQEEYNSYEKKYNKYSKKIEKIKNKIDSRMKAILEIQKDDAKPVFAGYWVEITYKALNLSKNEMPGHEICLVDPTSKTIIYSKSFDFVELFDLMKGDHIITKISDYLQDTDIESYDVDDFIDCLTI